MGQRSAYKTYKKKTTLSSYSATFVAATFVCFQNLFHKVIFPPPLQPRPCCSKNNFSFFFFYGNLSRKAKLKVNTAIHRAMSVNAHFPLQQHSIKYFSIRGWGWETPHNLTKKVRNRLLKDRK